MAPPQDRYTLHPITVPDDYPTLVTLSIESFKLNPFHYLVYPETANVSREEIEAYYLGSRIINPFEGTTFQTIKVVDNQSLDPSSSKPKIVGFATWIFDHECKRGIGEPPRPKGSDFRFLEDFRVKLGPVWPRVFDRNTDIDFAELEMSNMRVLPEYERKGLGRMMLEWGLERAKVMQKRIFLLASPQGRGLYEKYGFRTEEEILMPLGKYGGEGMYVQSAMIWDGRSA